ncbi:zinc finger protein 91-like [Maniola jurtina]|uniref:zinc finger protein 91-like n=1 Tax=Maniola jurtina TaxID=191418 RepID=UPI001E687C4B|nr:zinc finger protein 91-like [Maniola jurtina]XP_045783800.1 zinc finger protein 91-like [Maniola jurtina]
MTHLRVKHPSDHICNQCGYSYLNELGLRSHLRRIHRLDKVENPDGPLCEECNVRFASSAAYKQHLKVSPKHFTPETRRVNQAVPPRCYSKGSGRHKRRRGDPADVITCEQCGIELKDFLRYTFHFKREHPDKNRTQFSPNNQKVLCELCGKHFQSPHHLKYHMTKHTGQKDFQCDVCEKRFRIKAFLDKHKETHMAMTVRRLYTCAVCDKSFTCQSSLNRHVWIHRGKSFKCEICEKAFSNASERNCHVSHVHMKVPWPKRNRGPNRVRRPSLTKHENYDE